MFKPIVLLGLGVAGVAVLASLSWSQDKAGSRPDRQDVCL